MRVGWLVGGVLSVALLGCSDPQEGLSRLPPLSPRPSPSPTPSPSASPTVSAVPTAAQAATPEGAAAFARFWYAEIERAFVERDPEIVRRLSAPGCAACSRFVASLTNLRDNNERTEGVVYMIVAAEAQAISGNTTRVAVVYNGPPTVRYDASGQVIRREPAATMVAEELGLIRSGESWLVTRQAS